MLLLPVLSAMSMIASDNGIDDTTSEDTLIVIGSRQNISLEEWPGSATILTPESMPSLSRLQHAGDLITALPSVQAAIANGTQVAFQIRGVGAVDHQALTPGAAAVYIDDVFQATNVQTGALLYDLARVEVLYGPQGSLYGRNASSGAIRIETARPGPDADSYLSIAGGRFETVDVDGALSWAFNDEWYGRFAFTSFTQGPVRENIAVDPTQPAGPDKAGGTEDLLGMRLSIAQYGDNHETLFRGHLELDRGTNPAPRNDSLDLDDHEISVGPDGVQGTDSEFYGLAMDHQRPVGEWRLRTLIAWEGYDQDYGFDFDGTQAPFGNPNLNANLAYDRTFDQWSVYITASSPNDRHLIGGTLSIDRFDQDYLIWCGTLDPVTLIGTCPYVGTPGRMGPDPASDGTAMSLLSEISQDRTTAAIFGRSIFDLTPKATLTLGLRGTIDQIDGEGQGVHIFDDGTVAFNNRDGLGPAIGENTIDDTRLSGDAALSYDVTANSSVYISYANGFKSGGFNGEVPNNATHFSDEGLFEAETVDAVEIGVKAKPVEGLTAQAAAFVYDYDAPQARIFVDFPLPDGGRITSNSLSNLESAAVLGLEMSASYQSTGGLVLTSSVTLLDTEISDSTAANADLFDGNPLPFASRTSGLLSIKKPFELNPRYQLIADTRAKYRSRFYLDAEGLSDRRQDGYTTLAAGLSLYDRQTDLQYTISGENLLNEDYAISGFGFIGYNTFRSDPLTWTISIAKTWP